MRVAVAEVIDLQEGKENDKRHGIERSGFCDDFKNLAVGTFQIESGIPSNSCDTVDDEDGAQYRTRESEGKVNQAEFGKLVEFVGVKAAVRIDLRNGAHDAECWGFKVRFENNLSAGTLLTYRSENDQEGK